MTSSRGSHPQCQHLSCSCLTFRISSKKEKQETTDGEDGRKMAEVAWRMAEAREEEHHQAPPRPPSKYTLIHPWGMWTVCECVCVCVVVLKRAYEGVGELLAVLVLVVHNTFEPEAGEVLEDEVVVLRDAAWRMKRTSFIVKGSIQPCLNPAPTARHMCELSICEVFHLTPGLWICRCCKRLQMFLLSFPETDGSS